jgi:hypothetical protein
MGKTNDDGKGRSKLWTCASNHQFVLVCTCIASFYLATRSQQWDASLLLASNCSIDYMTPFGLIILVFSSPINSLPALT